jgi:D-alanine-D-alanine ligase
MKIMVLMGGDSPEREVSLRTGEAVAEGLRQAGHQVEAVDIPRVAAVMDMTEIRQVDVVFPALHGGQGEDGHLQALLDLLEVPYALSGQAASALAMDKSATKRIMRSAGIPTPRWLQVTWQGESPAAAGSRGTGSGPTIGRDLTVEHIRDRCTDELGFPLVIKLNNAGSSVGVGVVEEPAGFVAAFDRVVAAAEPGPCEVLVEEYIPGRELTSTILMGRRLPLLEIRPREGFYDYQNKYTAGATDYLVPAPVHSPLYEEICADALRLYEMVDCRGVARADFRLDEDRYHCLEINTVPGMTETSLVPKAAAAVGISFSALLDDLVREATQ